MGQIGSSAAGQDRLHEWTKENPPTVGNVALGFAELGSAAYLACALGKAAPLVEEGIYVVTTDSGKIHVGQSGNITHRFAQHVSRGKFSDAEVARAQRIAVSGGKTSGEVAEQLKIDSLGGIKGGRLLDIKNPIGAARTEKLLGKNYVR